MLVQVFIDIFQVMAISLGVGASVIGVAHTLIARADDYISPDEERLLRIDEMVLKIAFFMIFLCQATLAYMQIKTQSPVFIDVSDLIIWALISVIFIAMVFVGFGVVRPTEGVTVQVTSWFALGFLSALPTYIPVYVSAFIMSYIFFTIFALFIVLKLRSYLLATHTKPQKI